MNKNNLWSDAVSGTKISDIRDAQEAASAIIRVLFDYHCSMDMAEEICQMALKRLRRVAMMTENPFMLSHMAEDRRREYFESLETGDPMTRK